MLVIVVSAIYLTIGNYSVPAWKLENLQCGLPPPVILYYCKSYRKLIELFYIELVFLSALNNQEKQTKNTHTKG